MNTGSGSAGPTLPPVLSMLSQYSPHAVGVFVSAVVVTYLAFQLKLLPRGVSRVVSRLLFYPSFPITALMRWGNYWSAVDETVYLGCAPMAILGHPSRLHEIGVRGVVNMCDEYPGPVSAYRQLGIKQLRLPTTDHFEPSLLALEEATRFIEKHYKRGEKVYVHCKAGHGRGASVAQAWLMFRNPDMSAKDVNMLLGGFRKVRSTLYMQPNIRAFKSIIDKDVSSPTKS